GVAEIGARRLVGVHPLRVAGLEDRAARLALDVAGRADARAADGGDACLPGAGLVAAPLAGRVADLLRVADAADRAHDADARAGAVDAGLAQRGAVRPLVPRAARVAGLREVVARAAGRSLRAGRADAGGAGVGAGGAVGPVAGRIAGLHRLAAALLV